MADESTIYDLGFDKSLTRNTKIAGFDDGAFQNSSTFGDGSFLPNVVESPVKTETIQSGPLTSNLEQKAGSIFNTKTSFTDTSAGYRLGVDTSDGLFKFLIGNSTNSLYWNGSTLVITGSITATSGAIGGFEIGSDYIRDAANSFGLASTATSATELFGSTLFSDANLVSYWRFESSSADSKGSNNGTDTAITYNAGNGKFNNGAGFNGTSSQIYSQSSSFDTFGTSKFTIAIWVKLTALPTTATSFFDVVMTQEAADTATYDKGLRVYGNGSASFYAYDGATKEAASAASAVVAGTYTSLIGTYDGSTLRLYVNGTLAGSIACSSTYNFTTPRLVFGHKIAASALSEYLYGAIDDAAYFSRALSASEIANLAGGDDVRFWSGASFASRSTAPARITEAGVATFSSGTVGGWTMSTTTLVGGSVTLDSTGVITVGTSNNVTIISATDATYRLWTGNATAASAPFRVTKAGALTATSATISGAITATSGSITGAFTIGSGGSFSSGQTAYDTGTGFWLEYNAGTPRFSIGNSAGNKLLWNGTTLAITGTLTATSGAIGGWTIGATTLTGGDATLSSTGFLNLGTTNDIVKLSSVDATYRLWVGHATAASAPFSVTKAGAVSATSGTIGGWTLGATTLTATSITLDAGNQKITVGSGSPNLVIDGANNQMGTSTFVSGQSGWRITGSGNAEFNNIVARGEFRTAVFVKDEIHATGGTMIVLTASTLYADATTVTTPTTSTIDIQDPPSGHAQLFSVNDILRIKDGSGKDNWLKVTAVSDQTTFYRYTVDKQSGTNGTFYKGTAVVNYRTATDGFVLLTSDLSNGPYIDIGLSGATPWSGTTAKARLGNLAGITDSTFGALTGFGLWTNNGYFTGSVFATAGYFGDATSRVAIEAAGINVGTTGSIRGGQTAYDTGTGFWLGQVTSTPKFSLGNSAGNKLTWDGTTLSVTGTLTASAGAIGGFTIGATTISATNLSLTSGAANTANISVGTGSNLGGMNSGNAGSDIAFWAGDTFANRATAPFRVTLAGAVTMTSATISGVPVTSQGTFGGDGSDGALSTSSGTTTIDCGGAAYIVKNYTSISVTGTATVVFTNPHPNGTFILIKCQGNVTLTTSGVAFDASACGADTATNASYIYDALTHNGTSGANTSGAAGGAAGVRLTLTSLYLFQSHKTFIAAPGAGGGSGGGGFKDNGSGFPITNGIAGGIGGRGGGVLIFECNGAWNFTTGSISVAGQAGTNGTDAGATVGSGGAGAGGGAAGMIGVLYRTLTADSGTYNISGGAAGTGGICNPSIPNGYASGGGGGGAGSWLAAGTAGATGSWSASNPAASGGAGADGLAIRQKNITFA